MEIFERLDPARTALLVIDMQNGFLIPGFSPLEVPGLAAIVPNINRLARTCRERGVPVVWTQQTYTEEWRSWYRNFASTQMRDRIVAETAEGAHGFAIHESLDVAPGDLRVVKRRSSAFTPGASDLHERLQDAGRDALIITGTLSNVCCEATARDAMLMNYDTVFVSDANGARSDDEHLATLVNMLQFFADVRTAEEVVRLVETGASRTHPPA